MALHEVLACAPEHRKPTDSHSRSWRVLSRWGLPCACRRTLGHTDTHGSRPSAAAPTLSPARLGSSGLMMSLSLSRKRWVPQQLRRHLINLPPRRCPPEPCLFSAHVPCHRQYVFAKFLASLCVRNLTSELPCCYARLYHKTQSKGSGSS